MFNCTWDKNGKFFLGASLAGGHLDSFNPELVGTWGSVVSARLWPSSPMGNKPETNTNWELCGVLPLLLSAAVSSSSFESCLDIICNMWREERNVHGISL